MVFYTQMEVYHTAGGSTSITDKIEQLNITRAINDQAGTFITAIDNAAGKYSGTFNVGDDVKIYLRDSYPPTGTQIFYGEITSVEHESRPNTKELVHLRGMDYAEKLKDVGATEVFNDLPAGSIVKYLVNTYSSGLSVSGVQDGTTIKHAGYARRAIFDCVIDLADKSSFQWYVDNNADLHFEPEGTIDNGKIIGSGNTTHAMFTQDKRDMYNTIYIYGGRRTIRWKDEFTSDGVGSVYTLKFKPFDPTVYSSGVIQRGWIKELSTIAPSGTTYLHDYDNKQIIFISGTNYGTIPGSLFPITAEYGRLVPVVKLSEDRTSVGTYGRREKTIVDEQIKDPRQARDLALAELALHKNPTEMGLFKLKGEYDLTPGEIVYVNFPYQGRNNNPYKINKIDYNINQATLRGEETTSIEVSENVSRTSDILKKIIDEIKRLQAQRIDPSDIITRIELAAGSFGLRTSSWYIRQRDIGSDMFWDKNTAIWDTSVWDRDGSVGYVDVLSGGTFT